MTRLSVEKFDDRLCLAGELAQQGHDWAINSQLKLLDKYLGGVTNFGLRCRLGPESQYGFSISAGDVAIGVLEGDKFILPEVADECQFFGGVRQIHEPLMLSDNVQSMQPIENGIPSVIRFQRFKDAPLGTTEPRYEFTSLEACSTLPVGLTFGNGKIDLSVLANRIALVDGERENIERTSNGIDDGPDLDTERQREWRFFHRYYDVVSGITFRLFQDRFDVILKPEIQPLLEGWEIGYGPI